MLCTLSYRVWSSLEVVEYSPVVKNTNTKVPAKNPSFTGSIRTTLWWRQLDKVCPLENEAERHESLYDLELNFYGLNSAIITMPLGCHRVLKVWPLHSCMSTWQELVSEPNFSPLWDVNPYQGILQPAPAISRHQHFTPKTSQKTAPKGKHNNLAKFFRKAKQSIRFRDRVLSTICLWGSLTSDKARSVPGTNSMPRSLKGSHSQACLRSSLKEISNPLEVSSMRFHKGGMNFLDHIRNQEATNGTFKREARSSAVSRSLIPRNFPSFLPPDDMLDVLCSFLSPSQYCQYCREKITWCPHGKF